MGGQSSSSVRPDPSGRTDPRAIGATSPVTAGVVLVAVGSALTFATLDLSRQMLVHVLHGPAMPATVTMLVAKKLADFVLFAAFVDVALGAGLRRGALIGGLALAVQPIVSASSGGLVTITAGAAIVLLGRSLAARIAPTVADLAGGAVAAALAIFLSPWLLALLGLVWLPRRESRRASAATVLSALTLPVIATIVVAFARGEPLLPAADALERLRLLGSLCLGSLPAASWAIVALAIIVAARTAPAFVVGSAAASLAVALLFAPDLGAPFVVTILFAYAVTAIMDRTAGERAWVSNLAAVTVFLFALASTPTTLLDLLRTHRP